MIARAALAVVVIALAGCGGPPEASGHCEGLAGAHTIDADIIAKDSYFYRIDYDEGREEAQVEMAFGDENALALTLSMLLSDLPDERDQGEHVLGEDGASEDEFVTTLDVVDPFDAPPVKGGLYTLDTSSGNELSGALRIDFTDDTSITCDTVVPRDSDRDIDG